MTDGSDDLDDHQDLSTQEATETRRHRLHDIQADQAALLRRQEKLKKPILVAPPEAWPEAAPKALHLTQPLSAALMAQGPTIKELIA